MDNGLFHPKGPLLLFLADFEQDTRGWGEADKFRYLRVLDHLFRQGGFIPDDDDYLAEVMGLRKGRGWRNTVALIRSKLIPLDMTKSESKAFANDFLTGLQTVSFSVCLSQKRVLIDVQKAKERASRSAKGGHAKAANNPAPSSAPSTASLPYKKESKKEGADAPRRYAFQGKVIRLKSDDLETWRSAYHNIPNIEGELTSYDDYLVDEGLSNGDKWFHRTSAWLRTRDAKYADKPSSGQPVAAI